MTTRSPVRNQHPEDIKAAVRKRGKSLKDLALESGLSEATCRMALLRPGPKGNRAIADYLEKPLCVLWPEWFNEDGSRRRRPKTDAAANA